MKAILLPSGDHVGGPTPPSGWEPKCVSRRSPRPFALTVKISVLSDASGVAARKAILDPSGDQNPGAVRPRDSHGVDAAQPRPICPDRIEAVGDVACDSAAVVVVDECQCALDRPTGRRGLLSYHASEAGAVAAHGVEPHAAIAKAVARETQAGARRATRRVRSWVAVSLGRSRRWVPSRRTVPIRSQVSNATSFALGDDARPGSRPGPCRARVAHVDRVHSGAPRQSATTPPPALDRHAGRTGASDCTDPGDSCSVNAIGPIRSEMQPGRSLRQMRAGEPRAQPHDSPTSSKVPRPPG